MRSVLPLVVQARGTQVLHASAVTGPAGVVALCGVSTSGKSTLAAALMARGHEVVADDALAFRVEGGEATALTLPFRLRLRSSSAEALGLPAIAAEGGGGGQATFSAIVILEPHDDEAAPNLEAVNAAEAVGALMPHAYCFALDEGKAELVAAYASLVADGAGASAALSTAARAARRDGGGSSLAMLAKSPARVRDVSRRVPGRSSRGCSAGDSSLPVAKRIVSLERLAGWMAAPRQRPRDRAREQLAVRVAGRLWRSSEGPCLERSLALFRELGRLGAAPELVCGVERDGGEFEGHAWVEVDEQPLLEPAENLERYKRLLRFGRDGVLEQPE